MQLPAVAFFAIVIAGVLVSSLVTMLIAQRGISGIRRPDYADLVNRLDRLNDAADSVAQLEAALLHPKTRGAIGERVLERMLVDQLPRQSFRLQYGFASGARADAVIRVGERIVAIDAKFPLDGFLDTDPGTVSAAQRTAIIRHVDAIAEKYVLPGERTLPFALMYLPSESVFYRCFCVPEPDEDDMFRYAVGRGVVPTSPSGLFLYVQTILYGIRADSLARGNQTLLDDISQLRREVASTARSGEIVTTHLRNLTRGYDDVSRKLLRIERLVGNLERPVGAENGRS